MANGGMISCLFFQNNWMFLVNRDRACDCQWERAPAGKSPFCLQVAVLIRTASKSLGPFSATGSFLMLYIYSL
jgi:hypothetical protein